VLHLLNDVLAGEGRRILLFVLYVLQSTTVLITKGECQYAVYAKFTVLVRRHSSVAFQGLKFWFYLPVLLPYMTTFIFILQLVHVFCFIFLSNAMF
jgi:hypothetical protein